MAEKQMKETPPVHKEEYPTTPEEAFKPTPRDEETQQKLDETEALLNEIDTVLDTSVIEHELTMADLIRGGSLLRPQTFGTLRDCEGTCALGAAEDEAKRLGLL